MMLISNGKKLRYCDRCKNIVKVKDYVVSSFGTGIKKGVCRNCYDKIMERDGEIMDEMYRQLEEILKCK